MDLPHDAETLIFPLDRHRSAGMKGGLIRDSIEARPPEIQAIEHLLHDPLEIIEIQSRRWLVPLPLPLGSGHGNNQQLSLLRQVCLARHINPSDLEQTETGLVRGK